MELDKVWIRQWIGSESCGWGGTEWIGETATAWNTIEKQIGICNPWSHWWNQVNRRHLRDRREKRGHPSCDLGPAQWRQALAPSLWVADRSRRTSPRPTDQTVLIPASGWCSDWALASLDNHQAFWELECTRARSHDPLRYGLSSVGLPCFHLRG